MRKYCLKDKCQLSGEKEKEESRKTTRNILQYMANMTRKIYVNQCPITNQSIYSRMDGTMNNAIA